MPAPLPKNPTQDLDALLATVGAAAQRAIELVLAWPRWTAFALLAFALALTLLGRHGQRLLAGAVLACALVLFTLLFIRAQVPEAAWPGLLAVIGGGAAFALGLALPGWTTALASSVALGALGGFLAVRLGELPWIVGGIPGALLGLFLGLANHLWWGLWMPPLFAALCATAGATRLLAPRSEGALIPQLLTAPGFLATFGGLTIALLAISLERDHLRKQRLAKRAKAMADDELKAKLKRDRERHEKYLAAASKKQT